MTIDGIIPAEIAEEPEAIRLTLAAARPAARNVADILRSRRTRRVFVIGNGTSYHSSLAAASLHRRYATAEDPIVIALTAGDFCTYTPKLGATDALVGISASGEFRDVVAAVDQVRGRIPTIGIVHVADSSLARAADHVVLSEGGPSLVPVMTKTFASTLVATQLLLAELLGPERSETFVAEVESAASDAAAAITWAEEHVESVAAAIVAFEHVFVVGAGLGAVAAMEAALKLKEMALVHAEATEAWEMASGAATMIGPTAAVIALTLDGPGRDAVTDLARHAAEWGAHVIEVGPDRTVEGSDLLLAQGAEDHAPLVAVPPVALLAYVLAASRGATPDRPAWVRRYHSQGLHHILGV